MDSQLPSTLLLESSQLKPTDIKLDGLADQTKNGFDQLEAAVGDIWNQSKALSTGLSNRDLQIANIGRILGPASMLSPQILDGINIVDFEYAVYTTTSTHGWWW
jgi:hypothetical protein